MYGYIFRYYRLDREGYYPHHLVGRSQILLHILQYTGQSPQQRMIWSKMLIMPKLRNPNLRENGNVIHFMTLCLKLDLRN